METAEPDSTLRILVASDVHLGYMENDPVRGNDSFVSFEEILSIARVNQVDFILHGGDLFHENKPSRPTLHKCLSLLRKYCMGDKAVQFEYLSDQSADFKHCEFPAVNYEDPNLNISIPVFSIHGNHDDPTGHGNLCSLDLLHTAGLVNYFGKSTSVEKIEVSPVLLQKGSTKLSLYGLGSVRDERLHRLFIGQNVTLLRPKEHQEEWFNIFVLHQNRTKHTATNYIPETFLEDFLDLVIWGHEHECKLNANESKVEWNPTQQFYVCQPGSSVATSLSKSETVPKHVGLLEVSGKEFRMQAIRLETVRQFYMVDIILSKFIDPDLKAVEAEKKTERLCVEKVEALLAKAEEEHTGSNKQPIQPLIRLCVDYTGFTPFSSQRFGNKFVDRVANPKQIIHFVRRRQNEDLKGLDIPLMSNVTPMILDSARVEDMVHDHFLRAEGGDQLQLLSEKAMGMAVKVFVDKEEKTAIGEIIQHQLDKAQNHLKVRNTVEDSIENEVALFKEERKKKVKEEDEDVSQILERATSTNEAQPMNCENLGSVSDDDFGQVAAKPTRGRGRGSRGRGRVRGRKETSTAGDLEDQTASPSKGQSRGRGSQSRAKKNAVVSQTRSIADIFSNTSSKQSVVISSSDDDITLDDSDDSSSAPARGKSKPARGRQTNSRTGKRGISYVDDDDEDDFPPSTAARKRKR